VVKKFLKNREFVQIMAYFYSTCCWQGVLPGISRGEGADGHALLGLSLRHVLRDLHQLDRRHPPAIRHAGCLEGVSRGCLLRNHPAGPRHASLPQDILRERDRIGCLSGAKFGHAVVDLSMPGHTGGLECLAGSGPAGAGYSFSLVGIPRLHPRLLGMPGLIGSGELGHSQLRPGRVVLCPIASLDIGNHREVSHSDQKRGERNVLTGGCSEHN